VLSREQIKRYSRQILVPEVGGEGQQRLLKSSVLVVGAGGLGSPAIQCLAGAGVGRLGIVDGDLVDITNLHRQTIHAGRLGLNKALSAHHFVEQLNEDVAVEAYPCALTPENARTLVSEYDVVLDCTDNFPTRYLINDVCVLEDKPLVHASVLRLEGMLTTIVPGRGHCYRCIFPSPPPRGAMPTCQEAGVLGITTSVLGSLQAAEAIKLLLGTGNTLVGRLLHLDLLTMDIDEVVVHRNPQCPVCSDEGAFDIHLEQYAQQGCELE